jgi:hypothetical protein
MFGRFMLTAGAARCQQGERKRLAGQTYKRLPAASATNASQVQMQQGRSLGPLPLVWLDQRRQTRNPN